MREPLRLTLTTGPASLPVSLQEAKEHLCIDEDQTDGDALIVAYLSAAVSACEKFTGRALISQTWTLFRDAWPYQSAPGAISEGWSEGPSTNLIIGARELRLPRPPLQSITHIKTYDDSDVATTYAASSYFVDSASVPGRIVIRDGSAAPAPTRTANGLEIRFVAGHGDNAGDVPEELRTGILQLVAHLFEHREVVTDGTLAKVPFSVETLWGLYRVLRL